MSARCGVHTAVAKVVRCLVVAIGLDVALSTAGLDLTAAMAASTELMVGLGFGLRNVAHDFVSGLILLVEQPIRPGDFVQVGGTFGEVEDIGLRATRIITRDQVAILVPSSELATTRAVNHSRPTSDLRIASALRFAIDAAFGSAGITIPFPQRDLHVRSWAPPGACPAA